MKKSSKSQILKFIVYIVVLMLTSSPLEVYSQNDKDNYRGMGISKDTYNNMLKAAGFKESKYTSQSALSSNFVPFHDLACYYLTYNEDPSPVSKAAYFYYVGETEQCMELARNIGKYDVSTSDRAKICGYAVTCQNNDLNHYKMDSSLLIEGEMQVWAVAVTTLIPEHLHKLKKSINNFDIISPTDAQEILDEINLVRTSCSFLMNILGGSDREKVYAKIDKEMLQYSHEVLSPRWIKWMGSSTLRTGIFCNELAWQDTKNQLGKTDSFTLDDFWCHVEDTTENPGYDNNLRRLANIEKLWYVKTIAKLLANRCVVKGEGQYWEEALNFMLRARSYELFVNGDKKNTDFAHITWQSIAEMLDENECAIEHFEAGVPEDEPIPVGDGTFRTRNYAFVISKKSEIPDLLSRGYRNETDSRGISIIDELYEGIENVYMTSTPMMLLSDVAGIEDRIVRLYSLTDISKVKKMQEVKLDSILFIGDIAYSKNGGNGVAKRRIISNKAELGQLEGAKTEADAIHERFPQAKLLTGSQATLENVKAEMQKAKIIHISTHGKFDENLVRYLNYKSPLTGMIGINVLVASQLALSGYNDEKSQYICAGEFEELDLSNVDLVFLDACETGAGQEIANRVYSMAQSLHNAGVKCVIANLDPIPDNVATAFALDFYDELKEGLSYHEAFFCAKLGCMLDQKFASGDPSADDIISCLDEADSLRIILLE